MSEPRNFLRELDDWARSAGHSGVVTLPETPLHELSDQGALFEAVKSCMTSPDGVTRKIACMAMGQIGSPVAIPLLESLLPQESAAGNIEGIRAALYVLKEHSRDTGSSELERCKLVGDAYSNRGFPPLPVSVTEGAQRKSSGCSVLLAALGGTAYTIYALLQG